MDSLFCHEQIYSVMQNCASLRKSDVVELGVTKLIME